MAPSRLARLPRSPRGDPRAFVLVELLVAMGVIALLMVLLLGVVMNARHHARDAACKGNLCQLWKAVNYYANAHGDFLFINDASPMQIANTVYTNQAPSGWGHLYPKCLNQNRTLYCPDDPVRSPEWEEYGWTHWGSQDGEVQCSYGYRGRQGLVPDQGVALHLAEIDTNPQKVFGCDYYETHTPQERIHHARHINVLRCNGGVVQVNTVVSFGPTAEDSLAALNALDR